MLGAGSPTIVVHGVERGSLRPADHRVVPDRVEASLNAATGPPDKWLKKTEEWRALGATYYKAPGIPWKRNVLPPSS